MAVLHVPLSKSLLSDRASSSALSWQPDASDQEPDHDSAGAEAFSLEISARSAGLQVAHGACVTSRVCLPRLGESLSGAIRSCCAGTGRNGGFGRNEMGFVTVLPPQCAERMGINAITCFALKAPPGNFPKPGRFEFVSSDSCIIGATHPPHLISYYTARTNRQAEGAARILFS